MSTISSAGIGRSGVFIALCYLLEAIELHQILNVKQLVDTMRLYRPHLVQTCVYIQFINEILKLFDSIFRNNMNIFIGVWQKLQYIRMMCDYWNNFWNIRINYYQQHDIKIVRSILILR